MTSRPTLQDLIDSNKEFFTPTDVAGVLGCNPYTINIITRDCPERLGFPAFRIGTRVKIPKRSFLRTMGVENYKD